MFEHACIICEEVFRILLITNILWLELCVTMDDDV